MVSTRAVQKVRGPTKKENEFYEVTRCEGCDVIKTTPAANRSCCFVQALVVVKMFPIL